MRQFTALVILFMIVPVFSQDFLLDSEGEKSIPYELNGFIRGAFFAGREIDGQKLVEKSGYGELGLKMRVRKAQWGDGFAELRFRHGHEFDEPVSEVNIREAYVNTYMGNFDLRLGQQIVMWGRADGFNPTNNITPQNMLVRSSDEDDRRMGNLLFRGSYSFNPFTLELIWVPRYRASELPISLFPFPAFVTFGGMDDPGSELKNSSIAIKLDLGLSSVDGSISYFRGYMPLPGIYPDSIYVDEGGLNATIVSRPYQMQVLGGDFSTTLGSFGLRGEIAYRRPVDDYTLDINVHVPNPDLQCVLGVDKTIGDFTVILQYIGRYVMDFEEFKGTGLPTDQLYINNRMIVSQLNEMSHALFMRPSMTFLHETLDIEFLAYHDVTTEESLFRPVVTYDIADALSVKIGADLYAGPENTLFGNIEEALSSGFMELRVSF